MAETVGGLPPLDPLFWNSHLHSLQARENSVSAADGRANHCDGLRASKTLLLSVKCKCVAGFRSPLCLLSPLTASFPEATAKVSASLTPLWHLEPLDKLTLIGWWVINAMTTAWHIH